jgi:nucleotide-binding universal stress UspA family protein
MATPTGARQQGSPGGIVVGVDGSPGSLAAFRWALREGASRGVQVHAVTAWEYPVELTFGAMATVSDSHPVVAAEEILVSALADAGLAADHDGVTTTAVEGHAAEVLMQKAARAELLVVGSRGYGRIFGALLGSVSQYVAAHAACPVVVIKPVR